MKARVVVGRGEEGPLCDPGSKFLLEGSARVERGYKCNKEKKGEKMEIKGKRQKAVYRRHSAPPCGTAEYPRFLNTIRDADWSTQPRTVF